MTDISNKTARDAMVERFLDCDTTVDEERELAQFYNECLRNGQVPEGEENVCALVTSTIRIDMHLVYKSTTAKPIHPKTPWHWLAAACMAGIIAIGTAMALYNHESNDTPLAANDKEMAPTGRTATSTTVPIVASAPSDQGMPDKATPQAYAQNAPDDNPSTATRPTKAARQRPTTDGQEQATIDNADILHIYAMATDAFRDATGFTIERKGDIVLLSAANADGKCQRYIVNETGDGHMTFTVL